MTDRERIEYNNGIISGAVIRRGISSVVPFKTSAPTLPNITEAERAVFEKGLLNGLTLDRDLSLEELEEDALTLTYDISSTTLYPFQVNADALTIDWGDGTVDNNRSHSYSSLGEKTIHVYLTNLRTISFSAALSIVHSPFPYSPNVTSFNSCFQSCRSLTSIPAGLFDNCPNVTNFYACFYNCYLLIGDAPQLWLRTNVSSHALCFKACIDLSNFDEIPSDWK